MSVPEDVAPLSLKPEPPPGYEVSEIGTSGFWRFWIPSKEIEDGPHVDRSCAVAAAHQHEELTRLRQENARLRRYAEACVDRLADYGVITDVPC